MALAIRVIGFLVQVPILRGMATQRAKYIGRREGGDYCMCTIAAVYSTREAYFGSIVEYPRCHYVRKKSLCTTSKEEGVLFLQTW